MGTSGNPTSMEWHTSCLGLTLEYDKDNSVSEPAAPVADKKRSDRPAIFEQHSLGSTLLKKLGCWQNERPLVFFKQRQVLLYEHLWGTARSTIPTLLGLTSTAVMNEDGKTQ